MGYCFFTFNKINNLASIDKIYRHNYRLDECLNANSDLQHLNEELISLNGKTAREAIIEKINQLQEAGTQKSVRKKGVLAYDIVTTFSREDMEHIDINKWAKENVAWMKKTWNTKDHDNVLSMVLHRDEVGCVHIHTLVIPITEDGKLSAYQFTGNPKQVKEMQNSYANAMKKFGLKRGLENSVAKHKDIKRFYTELNQTISSELPPPNKDEDMEKYYERVNNYYIESKLQEFRDKTAMERKIDEAKTVGIQQQLEYQREKENYRKKLKKLQKYCDSISEESLENGQAVKDTLADLRDYQLLKTALKTHPNQKESKIVSDKISKYIKWAREELKEKDKEWEEFFQ